jgi:hypothetical protein
LAWHVCRRPDCADGHKPQVIERTPSRSGRCRRAEATTERVPPSRRPRPASTTTQLPLATSGARARPFARYAVSDLAAFLRCCAGAHLRPASSTSSHVRWPWQSRDVSRSTSQPAENQQVQCTPAGVRLDREFAW